MKKSRFTEDGMDAFWVSLTRWRANPHKETAMLAVFGLDIAKRVDHRRGVQ